MYLLSSWFPSLKEYATQPHHDIARFSFTGLNSSLHSGSISPTALLIDQQMMQGSYIRKIKTQLVQLASLVAIIINAFRNTGDTYYYY